MKRSALIILFISGFLCGCKKDQPSNPGELILGKWTILPTTHELYTNGSLTTTSTQQYAPSDYGDFKSNGTFQSLTNGTPYTNQYRLEGDTLIFDNVNKAKIKTLTSNSLVYYFTDNVNATQYWIHTFSYKK